MPGLSLRDLLGTDPDTGAMADNPRRMTLSVAQIALMREVLGAAPPNVTEAVERVSRGEVVPDEDADVVVDALATAMLNDEGYQGDELTARGRQIDDIVGVVQQMSQRFYE